MVEQKVFRNLIDPEEARKIFLQHAPTDNVGIETVNLFRALNRVLAEDVFSPISVPPFDRGSMDGFAVIAENTFGATEDSYKDLTIIGSVKAGYVFDGVLNSGQCVEISTGAPMPTGANAVVMVEYTEKESDKVKIFRSIAEGENVMSAGADIEKGERLLAKNILLTSRELAVLAAIGIKSINILKKPRVAIFSSGDEIVPLGSDLKPGKLFDINSMSISTGITENGGEAIVLGIIEDRLDELEEKLSSSLGKYDLIIVSGGTSAGMGDMLYTVVDKIGKPGLLVHGIKVKPGKPTILAVCNGTPIIGLPGYPASALSISNLFVIPYIRQLAGLKIKDPSIKVNAIIKQRFRSVMGRHEFKPVNLIKNHGGYTAFPVPGGSGAITSIAMADGFVEIQENVTFLEANSEVEVSLFSSNIKPVDLQIIGSHCIALAQLLKIYSDTYPNFISRSINVGSTGGVAAIRREEAHIAGVHIFNPEKGYNAALKDEMDIEIIPGYYRMQGFVVKKGNPKNIKDLKDLNRNDVIFLNRNKGSGTRILFDYLIKDEGIDPNSIRGYNNYVKSHGSIANAVSQGLIDVGVAIESVIDSKLEFIPIKEEEYDFVINNKYLNEPAVNAFIRTLASEEFSKIIQNLAGYRLKKKAS